MCKQRKILLFPGLVLWILFCSHQALGADSTTVVHLNIDQAIQTANENNKTLVNARLDVEIAQRTYLETLANGLPQISGSASFTDNLKLTTYLLPAEFFGGASGEYISVHFGTQYNASYGLSAGQLLFSAPFLVGLKTTKLMETLSLQGLEKSEKEIRKSVLNNYFLILISERSMEIIKANQENLQETLRQSQKLHQVGMREETDIDKITVSVSMLDNTIQSTRLNLELNYNMLRFQLGLAPETEIVLTSTLEEVLDQYMKSALHTEDFLPENHIDYKMTRTQTELAEKNLLSEKAGYLPSLSGYYSYNKQGMNNELPFDTWYTSSLFGFQLDIPLFNSGLKHQKVKIAKLEMEKAANNLDLVSDQLKLSEIQYRDNLNTALMKYYNQKDNVEVSKRIMENTKIKYQQGMASVFDLVQANDDYLRSESELLNATMGVLNASLELESLLLN